MTNRLLYDKHGLGGVSSSPRTKIAHMYPDVLARLNMHCSVYLVSAPMVRIQRVCPLIFGSLGLLSSLICVLCVAVAPAQPTVDLSNVMRCFVFCIMRSACFLWSRNESEL